LKEDQGMKVKGVTVFVERPGLYIAFHWRVFVTSLQRKKQHQPASVALAAWPLGTLEVSLI
jgi:hypothetical protein